MTNTITKAEEYAKAHLPQMEQFPSYEWIAQAARGLAVPYQTLATAFVNESKRHKQPAIEPTPISANYLSPKDIAAMQKLVDSINHKKRGKTPHEDTHKPTA
jgi:hypothetical protein